jgi:putative hydrolase of the HAD superfamily
VAAQQAAARAAGEPRSLIFKRLGRVPCRTMLANIEAVVFDLDGTLLDRRRSIERFAGDQWKRYCHLLQRVDQLQYVRALIEWDRDGYAPRKELFPGMLARFGLHSELGETLLRDYRAGFPSACSLFPDAWHTLAALRAGGFTLGLITNGSARMQAGKLNCLALLPAFDAVLISDVEGVAKPGPEIFRRALARLGTTADRAAFVGDHPEVDVSGARGAGMRSIWRRDPTVSLSVEADAVIDELADLLPLLGVEAQALES